MEKRKLPPLPLEASPQEKYDNLILTYYHEWIGKPNESCNWPLPEGFNYNIEKEVEYYGFRSSLELFLCLNALENDSLIVVLKEANDAPTGPEDSEITTGILITHIGFRYCHSLLESGKNSSRCFVAMAFKDDTEPFYHNGIAKAIEGTGFRPIRVDKEHTENEQTINDFIIASIKQSRFCIADLTHQRNGVYFEAGYALGRGLKVIYTCRRDDHANVHFDLKTMQTILYDTAEELFDALSLKIQAFILD